MKNLKLDIEEKLWSYLESEGAFEILLGLFNLIPSKEWTEKYLKESKEITDHENPIAKMCVELTNKHKISVEVKVFNSANSNIGDKIGCCQGDDYLYFFYNPVIIKVFNLSDISYILQHEIGHFIFRTTFNPEKFKLIGSSISILMPNENDQARFFLLANMISHISEFNADRFAVFATKDVAGYIACLKKFAEFYKSIEFDPEIRKRFVKLRNSNWKGKFLTTHPADEYRITALQCIENHLHNDDFDINGVPEVYNQMLKLLSFDEFVSEFGE